MPFIADDPKQHIGTVVSNGHCLRHVQVVALRTLVTALREHMGDKPSVVAFPGNALRHSR